MNEQTLGTLVVIVALIIFVGVIAWALLPYLSSALTLPVPR